MRGRPKNFNPEEALNKAMDLFWDRGFEATSIQDLVDNVGINRASMYDTFGDKRAFFCAAVEHYGKTVTESQLRTLEAAESPLEGVRQWFCSLAATATDGRLRGCLVTNTAIELAPHNENIGDAVRKALLHMEDSICNALIRAQDAGQMADHADARALARFLIGSAQGIVVLSRAGAERETIADMLKVALSRIADRSQ